jgi:hypothetical protein
VTLTAPTGAAAVIATAAVALLASGGGSDYPWFNITKAAISDAAAHTRQSIAKLHECGRLVGEDAPEPFA